jgi:predicted acyl esterase
MDEPMLRAWVLDSVPPSASYSERPGRWVAEPVWPSQRLTPRRFALNAGGLEDEPAEQVALSHRGALAHGMDSGTWVAWGEPGDRAPDRRAEDGRSLCFTSAPLLERLELLGCPEVSLTIVSDRPLALLAVRLCDVAPGGASALVTRAVLNLTHRRGDENPEALVPGEPISLTSRYVRRPTRSQRAIAFVSRSRPHTGRGPGPLLSPSRSPF